VSRVPYCPRCGAEISEDARFCPKCGTTVPPPPAGVEVPPAPRPAKTGIDLIGTDKLLQEHWIKRVVAFVIDFIALMIATWILLIIISIPILIISGVFTYPIFPWFGGPLVFLFAVGVLSVLYFTFAESIYGATIGKRIMGFKVITVDGKRLELGSAFIRNMSKIFVVLPILDVIVGLVTPGDPHQKYSDRIAGTTVTAAL